MSWNPYYYAYLGQEPIVRDQRGRDERPPARDHRGEGPLSPRVPPRDHRGERPPRPVGPDPRVTSPSFPQQPDPRITTRPENLRPRADRRDRDDMDRRDRDDMDRRDRDDRARDDRDRRHPRHRYRDYTYVTNYGWWPSWFPYWDPAWYQYWWQLYYYYGGDANRDYAEYARDATLRAMAPQRGWL